MKKVKNVLTTDPIVLNILELLHRQGKQAKDLEIALGLNHGCVTKWKYHGIKSYKKRMDEIAEFLEVPVEELKKDHISVQYMEKLETNEQHMVQVYRQLSPDAKDYLMQTVNYLEKEMQKHSGR